jgi:predicted transposase YbfD/YdcC
VKLYFEDVDCTRPDLKVATHATFDVDHGRIEQRFHGITGDVSWLIERHPLWKRIKSIGVIDAVREERENTSCERRYYVSSLPADPVVFAGAGRGHWGIENSLHYALDLTYREDEARIKSGVKQMAWNDGYLERLLFHSSFASEVPPETPVA